MNVMRSYAVDRATAFALSHRDRFIQIPNNFKMSSQKFNNIDTGLTEGGYGMPSHVQRHSIQEPQ